MRFIGFFIILSLSNFVFSQNNVGCLDISALNFDSENNVSDPSSCIYPSECSNNQQLIMIDIVTESWSSEITWNITDNENNIVANSPNLNSFYGDYQVTQPICLNLMKPIFLIHMTHSVMVGTEVYIMLVLAMVGRHC